MKRLLTAVNWLAAGVLGWAAIVAWLQPVDFLGDPDLASPVAVGSFTLAFLILINAARKWMQRWSGKTYRRVTWGLVALILVTQLIVAWQFVDVSRADAFYVRTQALALVHGNHQWLHYFMIYPNNVNFTLVEAGLIKLVTAIVAQPWQLLNGLRFLWVDTALLSGGYLLKRWGRARPATVWLLLVWLLSPPIYAYALYAYTDALVMPIVLDCLALMTWALNQTGWRKWGGLVGTGLLLGMGVAIKSNLVVFEIALVLTIIALACQRRLTWKTAGAWLGTLMVTAIVIFSLFGIWRQQAGYHTEKNSQLPPTSWMAMSLNPKYSGQYNLADFQAVNQQPTAAKKQRQATTMLNRRLKTMNLTGLAVHLTKKMQVFWATGDFDSFKLTSQWIHAPKLYVQYQRNFQFWLVLMTQAGYLVLLIEAIRMLVTKRPLTFGHPLLALSILGLTALHVLFWEVEPRYALPLLPGLMLLGAMGVGEGRPWVLTTQQRKIGSIVLSGLAVFSVLSLWQSCQQVKTRQTIVAVQGNGQYVENMTQTLQPKQSFTETIQTAGTSNRLDLVPMHASKGMVAIQIEAGGRLLANRVGTPHELEAVRYKKTSQQKLRVTITNVGHQAVRYGAVHAQYDPRTGQITAKNQSYLRYTVIATHGPQSLSPTTVGLIISVLIFGGAGAGLWVATHKSNRLIESSL